MRRSPRLISIGLAPMGSQLNGYGADQPFNRGFPRGEPGGERVSLFVGRGGMSIVRSIGASPLEAVQVGGQKQTDRDFQVFGGEFVAMI